MTVWYLEGSLSGPPPTSMYFCCDGGKCVESALALASSKDSSFVGVEMAKDLGRARSKPEM